PGNPTPAIGQMLIDRGVLTAEDVKAVLDEQLELAKREGELIHIPADTQLLQEKFCRDNLLAATAKKDGCLTVAIVDPSNILLHEEIQQMAGTPVDLVVAPLS